MAQTLDAMKASSMLNPDGADDREVPVEHMDYEYVNKCDDWRYLKRILEVLESGKEGRYFKLEEHTKRRMLELMPQRERVQFLALTTEPSYAEVDEAKADIESWLSGVSAGDQDLKRAAAEARAGVDDSSDIFARHDYPPVRTTATSTVSGMSIKGGAAAAAAASAGAEESKSGVATQFLGSGTGRVRKKQDPRKKSFKEYYDSWDKFDVEQVEKQMDEEEKAKQDAAAEAATKQRMEIEQRTARRRAQLGELRLKKDPATMPAPSRRHHALREKQKGNEYFRSQDFEDAVLYYSRSLMFDADSAVVLSNRAQAYLALKEWAKAEADGDTAVRKDPTYVKAWVRRAAARRKRGKYLEAIRDLQQALKLDPGNKAIAKLLREVKLKFENVEGDDAKRLLAGGARKPKPKPKKQKKPRSTHTVRGASGATRVVIEELSDSDEDDTTDDDSDVEDTPPTTSAPSSSTRVAIQVDDGGDSSDSDSDSDADLPAPPNAVQRNNGGSTRVAIAVDSGDDSDSDSDSDADVDVDVRAAGAAADHAHTGAAGSTRVAIQMDSGDDSDSDSDSDADLPAPPNAVQRPQAAATASKAAATSGSTRVAIQMDSGDDSDSDSDGEDLPPPPNAVQRPSTQAPAPTPAPTPAPPSLPPQQRKTQTQTSTKTSTTAPQVPPPSPTTQQAEEASRSGQAEAKRLAGNAAFKKGDLLGAATAYSECLRLVPDQVAALANRALVYLRLSRPQDAVQDCNTAMQAWKAQKSSDPGGKLSGLAIKVLFRRALAHKAQGYLEEAADDMRAVLAVEPQNPRPKKELKALEAEMRAIRDAEEKKAAARRKQQAAEAAKAAQAAGQAAQAAAQAAQAAAKPAQVAQVAPPSPVAAAPASPQASPQASPLSAKARQAAAMAERAKSILSTKALLPPVPRSASAFERDCVVMQKKGAKVFAAYLKQVPVKALRRMYKGHSVDSNALEAVVSCGAPALASVNPTRAVKVLEILSSANGFGMAVRMISRQNRQVLAQALDTVVSSPKAPKQAAERTAKLRKAYKL